MMSRRAFFLVSCAAASAGVFFGTANMLVHVPFLIMLLPAALALLAEKSPSPFRDGMAAGLPGTAAALYWIAVAAEHYGGMAWVLAVPCSVLLGAYVCLWNGAWTWCMARLDGMGPLCRALCGGLMWFFSEWCRGWFGTGFPWLTLSSGLAAWPWLVQPLSLFGAYAYSGVLAGIAVLCTGILFRPSCRIRAAVAAAASVLLLAGWSAWRMESVPRTAAEEGRPFAVALCQGNIRQDVKWTSAYRNETLRRYEELSSSVLQRASGDSRPSRRCPPEEIARGMGSSSILRGPGTSFVPDLVLWPETSMPFAWPGGSSQARELERFSAAAGTPLVFGVLGLDAASGLYRNRAVLLQGGGEAGRCDKRHLVPFGEYLPAFLDLKMFSGLLQGLGGFSAGEGDGILAVGAAGAEPARTGMLVCYEAVFPEIARGQAAAGAELFLNISNDAWYDRTSAPLQHLQLSLMRAVEEGRYLCRSTNTGATAVVDPLGGMLVLGGGDGKPLLFEKGVLGGNVLALRSHTPYFYLHPWLPAAAALALAAVLLSARLRRGRRNSL